MPLYSQSRAVASLAALYIFRMLGLFMVLPILSLSADDYSGSTVFLLGVALGIYGLTQALLQIPFGMLSDRFGRKPLIFIGLLLFTLGSCIAAYSDSIVGLIVGRALQGAGAIAGVIMAMVGDLTTEQNRTKAMATIGASIGVAFALSLIIGPWVSGFDVMGVTGVRLLFCVIIVLAIISMAILWRFIPSVSRPSAELGGEPKALSWVSLNNVLKKPQCIPLYVGVFALHYVLMAFFVVIPGLLEQVSIVREQHSLVYLGVMLCSFIMMVPLMIWAEKKQQVKTFLIVMSLLIIMALTGLLLGMINLFNVVVAIGVFFVGFNYIEANLPSLLTKILPSHQRGAGSGVFATSQFLGAALGGIIGGWLYANIGLLATFGSAAALMLLWLIVVVKMKMPARILKDVPEAQNTTVEPTL